MSRAAQWGVTYIAGDVDLGKQSGVSDCVWLCIALNNQRLLLTVRSFSRLPSTRRVTAATESHHVHPPITSLPPYTPLLSLCTPSRQLLSTRSAY